MAAPHVTGIVSLILSKLNMENKYKIIEVYNELIENAKYRSIKDNIEGYGELIFRK